MAPKTAEVKAKREMTEQQKANLARARELALAARKRKGLAGAKEVVFVREEPLPIAEEDASVEQPPAEPEPVIEAPPTVVPEPELPPSEPVVEPPSPPPPSPPSPPPKPAPKKKAQKKVINLDVEQAESSEAVQAGVDKALIEDYYRERTLYYRTKQALAKKAAEAPKPVHTPLMTDEEASRILARETLNRNLKNQYEQMAYNSLFLKY